MGCDIHSYVEQQDANGTWTRVDGEPFDWRNYSVFGWLADVRNYSAVPPLAQPRGLPSDVSGEVRRESDRWEYDAHSHSWFTIDELAEFDYDVQFEDLRVDGGNTAKPGNGEMTTYRDFLGPKFFEDLDELRKVNASRPTRVVFWFDN